MIQQKLISLLVMIFANSMFAGFIFAQSLHTKAEVRAMFSANTKDLWINYLCGTIDNKHVIDMIIGTDGATCKGLYTLRSSNTSFYFDGQDIDHKLSLVELNNDFRMTGFIYGKYDGEIFKGEWMSGDKNQVLPVNLVSVSSFSEYKPEKCENIFWQKIFRGKVNDTQVTLQLFKDHSTYTCVVHEDKVKYRHVLTGKGTRVESMQLNIEKSVLNKKWIVIDTSNLDKIGVVFLDENGYEQSSILKPEASLTFECYEYADYSCRLECMRPVSGNKKFDGWMENKCKAWIRDNMIKVQEVDKDEMATKDRWVKSANGWVEVDLFLDDLISGTIYMQASWYNETEKIPFIFDLKYGKEMELQDIFNDDFNVEEYFRFVIPAKKKEKKWKPEIKKWVQTQEFNYITLKDEGISFRTVYNTIYGEKEILIPYTMLEPNIKNKNIIKDLLGK